MHPTSRLGGGKCFNPLTNSCYTQQECQIYGTWLASRLAIGSEHREFLMLQELFIKSTLVYPIEMSVYSHKFRKSAFTLEVEHALCNTCQVYLISTTKETILLPTPVKSTCSECNLPHKNIKFVETY